MRGLNRTRSAIAAIFAAMVFTLAGASSASAVVPGGIYGTTCVSNSSGCAANLSPTVFNGNPVDVAVSPDGANVYVTTSGNGLLAFSRDGNGQLGLVQCVRDVAGCTRLTGAVALSGPNAVVVSPDGGSVYVANGAGRVLAFDRGAGGVLSLKAGGACVSITGGPGQPCTFARAMTTPQDLAIAGNTLYVAASGSNSVTALRVGAGGAISEADDSASLAACMNVARVSGCAPSPGLAGAHSLAVQGGRVYVGATKSIVTLGRDPGTGLMAAGTCVGSGVTGCAAVADLAGGVTDVAVGGDGHVFGAMPHMTTTNAEGQTVVTAVGRVVAFNPTGSGLARRAGATGCVSQTAVSGQCTAGRGLASGTPALAATPDGEDLYVAGSSAIELNRQGGGAIAPRGDERGCVQTSRVAGLCSAFAGFGTPTAVAIVPDGRHVYALAAGKVVTLRRDSSGPVCAETTAVVQHNTVGPLAIPCFDPDGDPLSFSIVNPPTLGTLGAFNHGAGTVVYAAPQGQNGASAIRVKAAYNAGFGAYESEGTINVNVVGAPAVVPAGIDADRDGFNAGQDCNDNNPNIRPGSTETKGNNTDENCDGFAEPFPTLTSGVAHNWSWKKRGTTFTLKSLAVTQQFPKGWKAQIKCSGKKCPFRTKALKAAKVKKQASSVIASLTKKQRRFRVGQTVEVWVSAPGYNTKVARITFKKGKQPAIVPYCVLPGSTKVQKTCT